ncbi:MAG: redoxin domain-containing protein [candidate division Zixibacteria bacterium]|nr:redoxin domain-containing protein [candidate division Zixibacteria bacterium]
MDKFLEGSTDAPEFPDGLTWFNVEKPLSLKKLEGKLVLLDFWTFCCINCMHVLPDLKKLERKYDQELVVVGVHSAKFTNELESEAIRQAVLRYEIEHPVVNDRDFQIWSSYGVSAWPSFVLINPKGKIIGVHAGEGIYEPFDRIIGRAVDYFEKSGDLKPSPLELDLERNDLPNTLLSFPGKVKSNSSSHRLIITDSNNDRIIVTDLEGRVLEIIGSGKNGNRDGSFEQAEFNHPQGTFLDGDLLYIADTENHAVRRADLNKREVETVLGCGRQARLFSEIDSADATCLNSPWDLLVNEDKLYIAMAGSHQIWVADPDQNSAVPYAGSGREARIDARLQNAALAQPSGIVSDGNLLYFADSETSSIRTAELPPGDSVKTLIGEDLFDYGDIDGHADSARLQHPLGVALHDGKIYIADTYNSKIKVIDPEEMTSLTYAGSDVPGFEDGALHEAKFNEPGGLTVIDGRIYVADMNNHAIRVIDMKTETVSTLRLTGLNKMTTAHAENTSIARQIELPEMEFKAGKTSLKFKINLPEGYELIEQAPQTINLKSADREVLSFDDGKESYEFEINGQPVNVVAVTREGMTELSMEALFYFCKKESGLCLVDNLQIKLPVTIDGAGKSEIEIPVDIEAKL